MISLQFVSQNRCSGYSQLTQTFFPFLFLSQVYTNDVLVILCCFCDFVLDPLLKSYLLFSI